MPKFDEGWERAHMRYRKTSFAVLALLIVMAILGLTFYLYWRWRSEQRALTLSDFNFLSTGMSLNEVIERVGEPDRDVGSGIFIIQYDLIDGRRVQLIFVDPDNLTGAWVLERDGTWRDLLEKQN